MLPQSIAIQSVIQVPNDLHSRFSATSRTYHYFISKTKDPFTADLSWLVQKPLNLTEMNAAIAKLVGHKNFKSFSKTIQGESTFECTVHEARWVETETGYQFEITANRFLRNMVRAIVGTLVEVGLGKKTISDFEHIITSQNRDLAGKSAPAQGLFLVKVDYANNKEDIF
jgi:tRNA pseudouridine38-40 synthase